MTILFVCSGNTCRSPLAVAAWRALEREQGALAQGALLETEVASAGTAAWKSGAATTHSQKIALSWKVDLSDHRARGLSQKLARGADLIITMTRRQAQNVRDQFGLPSHRVRVLGEFANNRVLESGAQTKATRNDDQRFAALLNEAANNQELDIADPFGGSLEAYESCAAHIKNCVKGLRQALREGAIDL